ncbi:DUF397 domain-containing protein [Streptomyces sp. NPDC088196]|uniref:DUF397 domain-containing protein n=1 Tax=Streptomyces sp. NPDC088196 TaxID=3154868 RepID=UPI00344D88CB
MIQWQKSSFSSGSDGANCVEVALSEGELLLREGDDPGRTLCVVCTGLAGLLHHLHGRHTVPT